MLNWTNFIRSIIREYGSLLAKIQITEEPNNPHAATGGDGSFLNVRKALIEGIIAASDEAQKAGYYRLASMQYPLSIPPMTSGKK